MPTVKIWLASLRVSEKK